MTGPMDGTERTLQPPGGGAPVEALFPGGATVRLEPLAHAVCEAYYAVYGDEDLRYGAAGRAWCQHDNQYLIAWAAQEAVRNDGSLDGNIDWLCRVLSARDFPLDRLEHDLLLAAAEVEAVSGGPAVADELRESAARVARVAGVSEGEG